MITIDDELSSRLICMETEQNRLDEMLAEVQKLEGQIHNIKATLTNCDDEITPFAFTDNNETITHKVNTTSTHCSNIDGYVVCLMFNSKSPVEWSGKKWQVCGKGKCYPSSDQAYKCLVTLQKRWPGYPFKILQR